MSSYELGLLVVWVALLGAVILPRLVSEKPLSFPMFHVGFVVLASIVFHGTTASSVLTSLDRIRPSQ